ncbi:MAG TPA: tetratricopeptide repeat protein [Candidatus Polarisedimenticolaceae bacterium]|nr:tetratricopeptide repeat protein [Candidatus Polarisedimenticolaceae bacterium]
MNDPDVEFDPELDRLERISNGVLDLIASRRFEDAAKSCETLRRDFPDQMDWMERTAMLHEAKGEIAPAIEHYQECIRFIQRNGEGLDPDAVKWYREKITILRACTGGP